MKIKNKLRLGFGFLFLIVLCFGVVSLYYIHKISDSAKVILKNNYESLKFAGDMRATLDSHQLPLPDTAKTNFDKNLVLQEHNITEKGEREATASVRNAFEQLRRPNASIQQQEAAEYTIRRDL